MPNWMAPVPLPTWVREAARPRVPRCLPMGDPVPMGCATPSSGPIPTSARKIAINKRLGQVGARGRGLNAPSSISRTTLLGCYQDWLKNCQQKLTVTVSDGSRGRKIRLIHIEPIDTVTACGHEELRVGENKGQLKYCAHIPYSTNIHFQLSDRSTSLCFE